MKFPAFVLSLLFSATLCAAQVLSPVERVMAPDFVLQDMEDETHRLSDYRGKTVIINFWTTWCPPCREEIPSMNRAWRELEDEGVVILAINMGEDEDTIFVFTADYPADFPLLMDIDGRVGIDWGVYGVPETFVIDAEGNIRYKHIGPVTRESLEAEVLPVIKELLS